MKSFMYSSPFHEQGFYTCLEQFFIFLLQKPNNRFARTYEAKIVKI
jgi:hypothetical protein